MRGERKRKSERERIRTEQRTERCSVLFEVVVGLLYVMNVLRFEVCFGVI